MSDNVVVDNPERTSFIVSNIRKNKYLVEDHFQKASKLFLDEDPTVWAGKDAEAYKQKLSEMAEEVNNNINDIETIASNIQKISEDIETQVDINVQKTPTGP
jgi:hypothetical protein